jgi:hypothetical protein
VGVIFSGPTNEQVVRAVHILAGSGQSQDLTLEQIIQQIDPVAVAMKRAGVIDVILWAESVSNILKDLGRFGQLTIVLVRDQRGYEYPVVRL